MDIETSSSQPDARVVFRRRKAIFLRVADERTLDVRSFLRGQLDLGNEVVCSVLCPITARALPLKIADLQLLMEVPSDRWISEDELDVKSGGPGRLIALARRGLVLVDPEVEGWRGLVAGEEALERLGWNELAAVFHAHTRWQGVKGKLADDRSDAAHEVRLERLRLQRGDPPSHFVRRADAQERHALEVPQLQGPFFEALYARRTTRAFRVDELLPLPQLEIVLYAVFAAHGLKEFAPGISAIRRTSPSGGALHPIEAYVLANHVDGLPAGLYHYESGTHVLARIESLEHAEVSGLITEFTGGQTYFSDVHAAVIHVARFDRNLWKYTRHRKAYKTVFMDSAHLSQTFYLTAAHLGLGAFYTAAINDADIGTRLGLDPIREAAVAINGLGLPDSGRMDLSFNANPYQPSNRD
jgi:putative peptide maturation dehydrogenase